MSLSLRKFIITALSLGSTLNGLAIPDENEIINDSTLLFPNLGVLIQTSPGVFAHQPQRVSEIRAQIASGAHGALSPRAYADIRYCSDIQCTSCSSWSGSYNVNFCLATQGTDCIIVYDLEQAQIHYWNHVGCNGAITGYAKCGVQGTLLSAPGTNSIGIQTGSC